MSFLSLDSPIKWIFFVHIIGGALALAIFIVPLLTKKGGSTHIKTGWIYNIAMITVALTAFVITPWRLFFDPNKTNQSQVFASFLFYVSVFTISMLVHGIVILKQKNRKNPSKAWLHLSPAIATIVTGIVAQYFGYKTQHGLLIAFPFLGHVAAITQLRYWLTSPKLKMHWWYEHMNSMFGACIATITAFLVTAIPRIFPGTEQSILLWVAPGAILGTISNRWVAYYKTKYERKN